MKLFKIEKIPTQFKATIAFILASSITQGLNLLVTPIFVRIMTTEEIGMVTNFNSWASLIGIIVNMMLYANSYMIAMNEFPDNRDEYTAFALCVSMISTLFFATIYFLNPSFFQKALGINSNLIILMYAGFFFLPATNFWLARQRYEYKYISVLCVSVITALIATFSSLFAVFLANEKGINAAESRIFATYIVNIIVAIIISIVIFTKKRPKWNSSFAKFVIVVNSPMIVHSLAKNVLDVSDRVMIAGLVGASQAGIYGTLYSLCTLIMILWNAINMAITPYMFSEMNHIKERAKTLRRFLNRLLLAFFVFSSMFTLVAPELIRLFTTDVYIKEIGIVPPIISGCYITAMYSLIGNVLLFNKKTVSIMLATLSAGITNVVLNYVCIPIWGFHVAAYTTVVGYAVLSLILYIFMRKIDNATSTFFDIRFSIIICVVSFITNMVISLLYPYSAIRYIIVILVLVLLIINRKRLLEMIKETKKS